jgi:hypothetical protein
LQITVATQNLRAGAWGSLDPARPDPDYDRLDRIVAQLQPLQVDALVVTEIRDQRAYNSGRAHPSEHVQGFAADVERMVDLGDALGMKLAGITPSRSGIPSAVLYRHGALTLAGWHDRFSLWFTNGNGTAVFNVHGCNEPLAVATVHADPWSWIDTQRELLRTVALVSEFNAWGILAGDFNCAPTYGPPANIERMKPHHRMNRLVNPNGPDPAPNLKPASTLDDAGYVDVAAVLDVCTPFPGETVDDLVERTRTGKTDRIDRIHLTPALATTPVSYRCLDTDPYASDHYGVVVTLDLELAEAR